jgi:type II secretory pathway pseudopilin PulG
MQVIKKSKANPVPEQSTVRGCPESCFALVQGKSQNSRGFTLIEILLYLGLFLLIIGTLYPILTTTLTNYLSLKGQIDLSAEVRNIFLRMQREVIKSKAINILTDWEVLFEQKNETIAFFLTQPVYLDQKSSKLKGFANNLSVGSISFSGDNYSVNFNSSSTCSIGSTNISSIYAFSGYAWSPNIGWIKFRNDSGEAISYGVCEDNNKELRGWAYNDIVGWISFNCLDTGVCATSNYKVIENNNYLYGYAWNDSLGWIIFDGQGGRVYIAKKNPYPYYVDLISDPRVFVQDLKFSQVGSSFKVEIKLQGPGGSYLQSETAIVLPFK